MNLLKSPMNWAKLILLVSVVFAVAALTMHGLPFTRQPDVQHIQYAFEILEGVSKGNLSDYLSAPKKYPLLYVAVHSFLYGIVFVWLLITSQLQSLSTPDLLEYIFTRQEEIHLVTRLFTVASWIVLAGFLWKIAKKLWPNITPATAIILLLCSPLVITLITAMRPHITQLTLLAVTFWFSIKLYEDDSTKHIALAFLSAAVSLCVLQNGLFAFIFPFYALIFSQGKRQILRVFQPRVIIVGLCSVGVVLLLGYPFILKELFIDQKFGTGLGNEDIAESPFGIIGFWMLLKTMIGSELILLLCSIGTLYLWARKKIPMHPFIKSIGVYIVLYGLFFGSIAWAQGRYFIAFTPLLAILGAPALARSHKAVQYIVIAFAILMHIKFGMLGLQPDTYDKTALFLQQHTSGPIASEIPHYHLGIQPTKESIIVAKSAREKWVEGLSENLPQARTFVTESNRDQASVFVTDSYAPIENILPEDQQGDWVLCNQSKAADYNASMFLWSEVDWPLYWLWRTERLGPNITVYCKT